MKATYRDTYCPILSAGYKEDTECSNECAWFNVTAKRCDMNVLADYLFKEESLMDLLPHRADTVEKP